MQNKNIFKLLPTIAALTAAAALTGCNKPPQITTAQVEKSSASAGPAVNNGELRETRMQPSWNFVPKTWIPDTGASKMRTGSWKTEGGADISVIAFPGSVGGVLANVNRWRSQVGLGPITQAEFEQTQPSMQVTLKEETGAVGSVLEAYEANPLRVEMMGPSEGIIGYIIPRGDKTWFIKMRGSLQETQNNAAQLDEFMLGMQW